MYYGKCITVVVTHSHFPKNKIRWRRRKKGAAGKFDGKFREAKK